MAREGKVELTTITNIDELVEEGNELAVLEYAEDIYSFYKATENKSRVHDYMDSQPDINTQMRFTLFEWLVEVHMEFELVPEILFLTFNIVDRFLSVKTVPRTELQLVGVTAAFIASKYEGNRSRATHRGEFIDEFAYISDDTCSEEQIVMMEKEILVKLEWSLTVPTPYVFLAQYIKASSPFDQELEDMAFSIALLGLMHYPIVVRFSPSMLAAASVYVARCTLKKRLSWTETLKHQTGYPKSELKDCAKMLVEYYKDTSRRCSRSKLSEAKILTLCQPSKGLVTAASSPCALMC